MPLDIFIYSTRVRNFLSLPYYHVSHSSGRLRDQEDPGLYLRRRAP